MCKNIITKPVLIGLIFLLVVSITMAGGRKPIENVEATLRELSKDEIKTVVQHIPTDALGPPIAKSTGITKGMNRDDIIKRLKLSEIKNIQLFDKHFPMTHFCKGIDYGVLSEWVPVYLWAIIGNKRIDMPSGFNQLLIENDIEVTDKNITEVAKAFVILAVGSEPATEIYSSYKKELLSFPQITFLEGKRSIDKKKDPPIYRVYIKTEINNQKQEWSFRIRNSIFQEATRKDEGKTAIKYYDFVIPEKLPKGGSLNLDGTINISTTSPSDATVEWEGSIPHYYLIVKKDQITTNRKVKFELSGFQPNQQHIAILVRSIDIAYADILLLQPVEINSSGNGSFLWTPNSETTCITRVWAIDTISGDTTTSKELTLEKVITGEFHNSYPDTFAVYFTDQFFVNHPNGPNHSTTFANYVKNAAIESWQKQCVEWKLGEPPDIDQHHQFFINNNSNWYHEDAGTWADSGANRQIGIQSNIWSVFSQYTNEDSIINSAIAHEFDIHLQSRLRLN